MSTRSEAEWAQAFAAAIVKPGGSALLIDEDNRAAGDWVSVEAAVESGQAFAVEPCDHMLAVDIDEPADRLWAGRTREALGPRGCQFVTVESGREGHRHLWVLLPSGWNYEQFKTQAEALAGAPRTWSQLRRNATRPPYAPHRLGGRSKVLEPGPDAALNLFQRHRPQPIPRLAIDSLRWLEPHAVVIRRGVIDRGRTIHRAAVSLINARRPQSDLVDLLREQENAVTSKYWELDGGRQRDYVERVWADACRWVREHPPVSRNRETLEGRLASIPSMEWRTRTGANDRRVYRTVLELGIAAASLTVNASIRQLAELSNLSTSGVQAALRRLCTDRYLERVAEQSRLHRHACSYRVVTDVPTKSSTSPHTLPFYGGPKTRCVEEAQLLADVFSNGTGLGASVRETWEALPEVPTKTAEVSQLRPGELAHNTVLGHLRRLDETGLARRAGHRWVRLEPSGEDLLRLARLLGVRGKNQRRVAQLQRERQEYLARFHPDELDDPAA
ncbi:MULTISPECIES: hypothetical protein [unclassified Nocardioides]|uniref:hypothetical protein n=1 Tax=unclassified Nocardioides TaxID=2615069 RepID=UPI00301550E9